MLSDFSKALDAAAKARQADQRKLNKQLGEPAVFVPDPDDGRFGTGYWRAKGGGVFSYRRYANGYDINSRVEYSPEFIDILNKVNKGATK